MVAALGWRVLRFWNSEVERNLEGVVAAIRAVARAESSRSTG
jgi:very-short-patch-repair endonuclease